jgi:chromate transporter
MDPDSDASAWQVFLVFLKLGLTSFGGPVAHLGFFRDEFVVRRKWLDDRTYADLIALCQFLPGPASSQAGLAIGLSRAGYGGALAAWLGFTLPSAIALIVFAANLESLQSALGSGWLHGLMTAAVAVVALAVVGMARTLAPDAPRLGLAAAGALVAIALPSVLGQIAAILLGGLVGFTLYRNEAHEGASAFALPSHQRIAIGCLVVFFLLLGALPLASHFLPSQALAQFDAFYRAGALVFGGGHVVLPLLQSEVVAPGWVSEQTFIAGYGAAQAVPGPLFTFAAYLGATMGVAPNGLTGGLLCLIAIFLPSFLLVAGALPYWDRLRRNAGAQAALKGVNASVVGLLLAALYDPVWGAGISGIADAALAAMALLLLYGSRMPVWLVVFLCAAGGGAIAAL